MKISIVATLYQSAAYISEFHRRASAAARAQAGDDYEIVFVNDGSPDASLAQAVQLSAQDPHVIVVDLSRNFGHHKAMMTGLAHARGERVFLLDVDLEEDPEWLASFCAQLDADGCDVVYGVQEARKGGWFERWSGQWFWSLFNASTGLGLTPNIVTARVMTRRYVDALLLHDEREVFMAGLWHITGFDQRAQVVSKKARSGSSYTLRKKIALLVNAVTSFSNAPLIGIFYLGAGISLIAGAYTLFLLLNWLLWSKPISGWTSVMASIWMLGGLVIFFIGLVGVYLSKMYSETKRRPYTIVRRVYGR